MGATETLVRIRCLRALLFGAQGAPRQGRASAMLPRGAEATHRAASQERSVRTEWPEGAHGRGGGCSAAGSEREQVGAGKEQAGRAGAASARRPDLGPALSAPARACAVRDLWLPPRTSRTASRTSRDLHLRPRSALAATHPRPGRCHLQGRGVGRTCGWPGDPTNGCCVKWAVFWGTEPFSPCL